MEVIKCSVEGIEREIQRLEQEKNERVRAEYAEFAEKAKTNIGRCFKLDGEYVKVIDVPTLYSTVRKVYYNKYSYPAFFIRNLTQPLGKNEMPFYYDRIHSGAWNDGARLTCHEAVEITEAEFDEELRKSFEFLWGSLR
jgi:hypothetical protein